MRSYFLILFLLTLSVSSLAQLTEPAPRTKRQKPVIYSASSDWQKVTFKATPRLYASPEPAARTTAQSVSAASAQSENAGRTSLPATPVAQTAPASNQPMAPATAPVAQPTVATASAPIRRNPAPGTTGYRPAFTGDFATNRNGWKAGNKGDYNYQIGLGKYNIRKRNVNTNQVAFSYVPLPTEINLNIAETFTIKVDVVADSGRIPTGGLLFGVADSLNYCAFSLNSKGEITIVRVVNGQTFSDYMPGESFRPGVLLEKNRNRLIIRRNGDELHFYINDNEVRSSPYPFRMLSGNGIGLTTTGYWTSFQKLAVTLGP